MEGCGNRSWQGIGSRCCRIPLVLPQKGHLVPGFGAQDEDTVPPGASSVPEVQPLSPTPFPVSLSSDLKRAGQIQLREALQSFCTSLRSKIIPVNFYSSVLMSQLFPMFLGKHLGCVWEHRSSCKGCSQEGNALSSLSRASHQASHRILSPSGMVPAPRFWVWCHQGNPKQHPPVFPILLPWEKYLGWRWDKVAAMWEWVHSPLLG